jgi:L-ascorbate metabolism protein UlaG (beta-lactamase superfamily)
VLSARILGAGQRLIPPGLDRLPPLDLLLISHNHYDHLDAPTLRPLARETPVVVPCGLGRWFRRRGFTSVTERDWWESVRVGGVGGDVRAGAPLEPTGPVRPLRDPAGWFYCHRGGWPAGLSRWG